MKDEKSDRKKKIEINILESTFASLDSIYPLVHIDFTRFLSLEICHSYI
jgi:hypothetical protein